MTKLQLCRRQKIMFHTLKNFVLVISCFGLSITYLEHFTMATCSKILRFCIRIPPNIIKNLLF